MPKTFPKKKYRFSPDEIPPAVKKRLAEIERLMKLNQRSGVYAMADGKLHFFVKYLDGGKDQPADPETGKTVYRCYDEALIFTADVDCAGKDFW